MDHLKAFFTIKLHKMARSIPASAALTYPPPGESTMASFSTAVLLAFLTYLSAVHAFTYHGPTCRAKSVFPYVTCAPSGDSCFPTHPLADQFCAPKQQFGCRVSACPHSHAHGAYTCAVDSGASQPCSHQEIPANDVNLTEGKPLSINLRLNPVPPTTNVILLIDAAASVKPHFEAIKPKLVSFLNSLETSWALKVGVGIYGPEGSFDSIGISALSAVDEDVSKAVEALERVPEYPDGPRTTLMAIRRLGESDLEARGERKIVFLIGDAPGREPACYYGMNREYVAMDVYGYSSSISVIPISVGSPGLDASIPEAPAPCADNEFITPAPVPKGQATYLAANTGGLVITNVTPQTLMSAFETVRRNPARAGAPPPGSSYSVTTARLPLYTGPYSVPEEFQRYSNGCEDNVSAEMSNLPDFLSTPNVVIAQMKLTLKRGICARGRPFTCEVRVREHVNTWPIPNVWNRPLVKTEIINIHAC